MAVVSLSVSNGTYRIHSLVNTEDYLERADDGTVRLAALKEQAENQKWTITVQHDGTYRISASTGHLSSRKVESFASRGERRDQVVIGGDRRNHPWTLETRGDTFVLGIPDSAYCAQPMDDDDTVILTERKNTPAQRWILETLDPSNLPTSSSTERKPNTTSNSTTEKISTTDSNPTANMKVDPNAVINSNPKITSTYTPTLVQNMSAPNLQSGTYKIVAEWVGKTFHAVSRSGGMICFASHGPKDPWDSTWTVTDGQDC